MIRIVLTLWLKSHSQMNSIFLSIGSNLGHRFNNLKRCINEIKKTDGITFLSHSKIYETEPMYNINQSNFLNLVIKVESSINPNELLKLLKNIEFGMGRELNDFINSPRVIDIDILSYGDLIINNEELNIPHKKISERLFVLKPWTDIEPNYKLPQLNKTISYLISQLDMNSNVIRLYGKSL